MGPPTTTLRLRHSLQGWVMTGGTEGTKRCEQYDSPPPLICTLHHGPSKIRPTSVVRLQKQLLPRCNKDSSELTFMIIPVMPNTTPGATNETTAPLRLWCINCHNFEHKSFAQTVRNSNKLHARLAHCVAACERKTCTTNQPVRRNHQLLKRGLDLRESRRQFALQ